MDNSSPLTTKCENHIYSREEDENKELSRLDSVFQMADLTLKVGNRKLYVTQEEFKQISVVFEKMLSDDFVEKQKQEINFTGKDYKTFVKFIRVAHPGLQDPFDEESIHQILPLIDEYLAENARKRADYFLTALAKKKSGSSLSSQELVQNIVEAEKYKLPKYLGVCINLAAKKILSNLTADNNFQNISLETRYKISMQRWKHTDHAYQTALRSNGENASRMCKEIGEKLYNFIEKN